MRSVPSALHLRGRATRRTAALIAVAGAACAGGSATAASPSYTILRAGLFDAEHTATTGVQGSSWTALNASGDGAGLSERFATDGASLGRSVWALGRDAAAAVRTGLFDAEHTAPDGSRLGRVDFLNAGGDAAGAADRYAPGGGLTAGQSAWVYRRATGMTVRCGATDAEHTSADGARHAEVCALNDAGDAAGSSRRYAGVEDAGSTAWALYHDATVAVGIGLIDAEHTRSDGYRASTVLHLGAGGDACGLSDRFADAAPNGRSAWIHHSGTGVTEPVGLTDAEHTGNGGYRSSTISHLSASGVAVGSSERYLDGGDVGSTLWRVPAGSNQAEPIGLGDAEHTTTSGIRYNTADAVNAAGDVLGHAGRYAGNIGMGLTTWVYDHTSGATTPIGFTDAAHTRADGYRSTTASLLNASGDAAGGSERYGTPPNVGLSVWVYRHATGATTRAGLYDAPYTGDGGFQFSVVSALNGAGDAAGSSSLMSGPGVSGVATWVHPNAAAASTRIGPSDARHTDPASGFQYSIIAALNSVGDAAGYADRFGPDGPLGQSAWVYDHADGQTLPLVFSARADGYAATTLAAFTDAGVAVGSYELFDGAVSAGWRAYRWSRADGFDDLGALVGGGLTASGWLSLTAVQGATPDAGAIVGAGSVTGGGGEAAAYVLRASVPLPPCTADWNADGEVNGNDISDYINSWYGDILTGTTLADVNADGETNGNDISDFVNAWYAGVLNGGHC